MNQRSTERIEQEKYEREKEEENLIKYYAYKDEIFYNYLSSIKDKPLCEHSDIYNKVDREYNYKLQRMALMSKNGTGNCKVPAISACS